MVMKLKEFLEGKVKKEALLKMPGSYNVIGDILIFNAFPNELNKYQKTIGNNILKFYKNIKVVAIKTRKVSGRFRLQKLKIIAGSNRKETIHKENGIKIKLDVEKCYFSPRQSTERLRIARLVKLGETVLVAFSGTAAYPLVIAKNSKAKAIYAIELNKIAHKYAEENIKLNKMNNIFLYNGDVKKMLPKINKKFDRLLLPLPKTSENYLKLARKHIKKTGVIHYYTFLEEDKIKNARVSGFKVIRRTICGHYSPRIYRVCFDLKLA